LRHHSTHDPAAATAKLRIIAVGVTTLVDNQSAAAHLGEAKPRGAEFLFGRAIGGNVKA
jgi:hypothetical protein